MKPIKKNSIRGAIAIAMLIALPMQIPAYGETMKIRTIDVHQAQAMKGQGVLLLDVREPGEFEQGHAPGSVLVPLGQLKARLQEIRAYESKPVAVICRSGRRSAEAAYVLSQAGFSAVSNIQGGMIAWEAAALPVVKGGK
jgi:rhodanese-related sulfurtransferase